MIYSIFRQADISEDTCNDLTQDVFVKLLSVDIIREDQIDSLVAVIAYRQRCDYFRRKNIINRIVSDKPQIAEVESSEDISKKLFAEQLQKLENRVVETMSAKDAKTYTLSRFEDKSIKEIAVEMSVSNRSVEARLYRSRALMRAQISKAVNY